MTLIKPEDLVGAEWAEWYRLTPMARMARSAQLMQRYLAAGGSLAPEFDPTRCTKSILRKEATTSLRFRAVESAKMLISSRSSMSRALVIL